MASLANGFAQSSLQFSTNIYYVAENAGSVLLTVQRTGDPSAVVSVDYATADGTATDGLDYATINGTLTFLAGETNQFITVPILNDGVVEAAVYESFTVTLTNPTNASLGTRTIATVRITDNDKGLAFEFGYYSVAEDAGSVLIGVVRTDDGDFPVSVDYFTTASTAIQGLDFTGVTNTLFFAAGEKVQTFTVPILNDGVKEGSELFRVTLSNPTNQVLGSQKTATVSTRDNDPGVEWEFAKCWIQENEGDAVLVVRRGNDKELGAFTVDYQTTNLTAVAGQDYQASSGTLSFAEGETQKTVVIPIVQDDLIETSETFKVSLLNANGAPLGARGAVTVTILDMTGMSPHRFGSISVLPDRTFQMSLTGAVNPRFKSFFDLYPIEASANLVEWFPLVTLQRTNSATNALLYADDAAPTMAMRFYRTPAGNLMTPLQPPSGPFAVGQVSLLLTDPTRRNRYLISTNGSFMVTVSYPAQAKLGSRPCPLDDWGRTYISQDQAVYDPAELSYIPQNMAMINHALPSARFASAAGSCPVVVFSPGATAPRSQAQYLAEHLASHGYVWVSVDHADAFPTIFPDGRYIDERSATMSTAAGLLDRVQDLRFILNELARWNVEDPLFAGSLDLSRVAAMGYSWGGGTVAELCRVDARCRTVVLFEGTFQGAEEVAASGLPKPSLEINASSGMGSDTLFRKAKQDAIYFQVSGTTHGDFGGLSDVEVDRTCKDYALWFLNKHLKGSADPMPALASYPRVTGFKQK